MPKYSLHQCFEELWKCLNKERKETEFSKTHFTVSLKTVHGLSTVFRYVNIIIFGLSRKDSPCRGLCKILFSSLECSPLSEPLSMSYSLSQHTHMPSLTETQTQNGNWASVLPSGPMCFHTFYPEEVGHSWPLAIRSLIKQSVRIWIFSGILLVIFELSTIDLVGRPLTFKAHIYQLNIAINKTCQRPPH